MEKVIFVNKKCPLMSPDVPAMSIALKNKLF